jgi:hypothetical protein
MIRSKIDNFGISKYENKKKLKFTKERQYHPLPL